MKLEGLSRSVEIFLDYWENEGFSLVVGDGLVFGPSKPPRGTDRAHELIELGWSWDFESDCWSFW